MKLLEGDEWVQQTIGHSVDTLLSELQNGIEETLDEELDILLADSRYGFIKTLTDGTVRKSTQLR